jgi:hypothetical protein
VIFGGTIMLLAVVTWILFGNPEILRGHTVGILMGIASGAAILSYTVGIILALILTVFLKETEPASRKT